MDADAELDSFKQINLLQFALKRGYTIVKERSTATGKVLWHKPSKDFIHVSRASDGHWQYYSFKDDRDNGTIIDFLGRRDRLNYGQIRVELRPLVPSQRAFARTDQLELRPRQFDREAVKRQFSQMKSTVTNAYLQSRHLRTDTLSCSRFARTWRTEPTRRNAIFPHYDGSGLCGYEQHNQGWKSFAKGGARGLWVSRAGARDDRIVITESAVDAMSHFQLNPYPRARYLATGGELSPSQLKLIRRACERLPGARRSLILATDNDKAGDRFAEKIADAVLSTGIVVSRHAPSMGKDWNEQLQLLKRRELGLARSGGLRLPSPRGPER